MQDRQEWLNWRHQGIGSSDAPVIMNVSPWKTPYQLWEEKTSSEVKEDPQNQFIKDKGNRVEPKVRELYGLMRGFMRFDPALVELDGYPHIRASLDGRSVDGKEIIEIKLSGKEDWTKTNNETLSIEERIPAKYWPQIQHQLGFGFEVCHYLSYYDKEEDEVMRMENLAVVSVIPNHVYISKLASAEHQFWELVKAKKPPPLCDRDYKTLRGFAKQANKYARLAQKAKEIESEMDDVKAELLQAASESKHSRLTVGNLKISRLSREGTVDWKKALGDAQANFFTACEFLSDEERALLKSRTVDVSNPDQYRKAGSTYWRIDT